MIHRFLLLAALCVHAAPCQQTVVVTGGGSALQQAVANASPGDTLVVRAATYSAVVLTTGLTILCDPGTILADAAVEPLRITGVPAGSTAIVRGAQIHSTGFIGSRTLHVSGCSGAVILDGVVDISGMWGYELKFESCSGPVLVRGFTAAHQSYSVNLENCTHVGLMESATLPAVIASGSGVHITNCTVPSRVNNLAALSITNSVVAVTGCALHGAPLTASFWWSMPGIAMSSGELTVAGNSLIVGGTNPLSASAIETTGGAVWLSHDTRLVATGVPVISGPAAVVWQAIPAVRAMGVSSGALFTAQVAAEPASFTATLVNGPRPPIALPWGTAWIAVNSPPIDIGVVPASGTRTVNVTIPPLPVATPILLQPASLTVTGQIIIGPPTAVLLN